MQSDNRPGLSIEALEAARHKAIEQPAEPPEPEPGYRITVELWVSDAIATPVQHVRDLIKEDAIISILDVWIEDPE